MSGTNRENKGACSSFFSAWDCLVSILLDVLFMCVNYRCTFFQWAEFNDDGEPPWVLDFQGGGKVDVEKRGGG